MYKSIVLNVLRERLEIWKFEKIDKFYSAVSVFEVLVVMPLWELCRSEINSRNVIYTSSCETSVSFIFHLPFYSL